MIKSFERLTVSCLLVLSLGLLSACQPSQGTESNDGRLNVVATTSMIADLVSIIGGDDVVVEGLMGPGVDPHLYRATEGNVLSMAQADVIFYNGLHLEGKMTEIFDRMRSRQIETVALVEASIPDSLLIVSPNFAGNYDPHVWFDVTLWQRVVDRTAAELSRLVPALADSFQARADHYHQELNALKAETMAQVEAVPEAKRVLITSHDAFGYFGQAYGFQVEALQGLSTAAEAGTADVQRLAEFVATHQIPAVFIESSVSARGIEAVKAAVAARGFSVEIGGNLFSDALGDPDTPEGTYTGTVRHNVSTIVLALSGDVPATE